MIDKNTAHGRANVRTSSGSFPKLQKQQCTKRPIVSKQIKLHNRLEKILFSMIVFVALKKITHFNLLSIIIIAASPRKTQIMCSLFVLLVVTLV